MISKISITSQKSLTASFYNLSLFRYTDVPAAEVPASLVPVGAEVSSALVWTAVSDEPVAGVDEESPPFPHPANTAIIMTNNSIQSVFFISFTSQFR